MAVQPLASQVGVAPACRALGGATGFLLPSSEARSRASAAPSYARPGPVCVRNARTSSTCSPARASSTGHRPRSSRRCSMKASICAPSARCTGSWPRTSRCESGAISAVIPATPSPSWWPRAPTRPGPGISPGSGGPNADVRWTSFYLYVLLDIFSRCVVGWMVADRENAALAVTLIEETCLKQGIEPQVLTLHSDRGAPMTSKCTAQLLADLGVTRSLSRPQVSDDNPFSEAQFKTLKYHPGFPGRFEDITAAIAFCRSFFPWYNTEHRHAGIAMLTPDDVHHHRVPDCAGSARTYPASRLGPSPRTLRPRHPETRPASRSRLDQPTRHFHNRRNESVNRNRRCLKVVDRFRVGLWLRTAGALSRVSIRRPSPGQARTLCGALLAK